MSMPYKKYQVTEIKTSDPVRIVVLLYEGAIKNLNQAIQYLDEDNKAQATGRIVKTQEIVNYLRTTLDFEQGGEIAENLDRLYTYINKQLTEAQLKRDKDIIQGVIPLLQTLLEGWQGVAAGQSEAPSDTSQVYASEDDGEDAQAPLRARTAPQNSPQRSKLSFVVG